MAFLPSLGFLGFEIHIFYCNTPCLVWLPIQHRRKPISREPDFSVQKLGFLDGFLALCTFGEARPAHAGRDQFAVLTARVDATSCSVSLENPNNRARGL